MEQPTDPALTERPKADWLDWGDCGVIICEDGNTDGWIKVNEDLLVSVEEQGWQLSLAERLTFNQTIGGSNPSQPI